MSVLYMCRGLPASGKTTWAKGQVANYPVVRVNKDDLREMMFSSAYSKANEQVTVAASQALVHAALAQGRDVIVDDTGFNPYHEQQLRKIAEKYDAHFVVKEFDVDLQDAIQRDSARDRSVGAEVIQRMYNQYLAPKG